MLLIAANSMPHCFAAIPKNFLSPLNRSRRGIWVRLINPNSILYYTKNRSSSRETKILESTSLSFELCSLLLGTHMYLRIVDKISPISSFFLAHLGYAYLHTLINFLILEISKYFLLLNCYQIYYRYGS